MKLLKRTSPAAQHDNLAFAQRLDSIASRSKAGTALYDYREDLPSGIE